MAAFFVVDFFLVVDFFVEAFFLAPFFVVVVEEEVVAGCEICLLWMFWEIILACVLGFEGG